MAKITIATIKKFIKENKDNLYIKTKDRFDGMYDCVMEREDQSWHKVTYDPTNTYGLGIPGAFFVKSSRDYFTPIENGYEVYNACGTFQIRAGV